MKEFLSVLRLQDLQLEKLLWYWNVTDDLDPAYIKDSGHNIYFEQLGYNSRYIVRNCPLILLLLSLWTVFCILAYALEFFKNRDSIRKGRLVDEKPSFGINGRVKQYRSNYFHIAVQGLTRIMQVAFVELFLFGLVNLGEFKGDSKLSHMSKVTCWVVAVAYTLFFLAYPFYRAFLQDYFTVRSLKKAAGALPKKKSRRQRVPSTDRDPDMNSSASSDAPAFSKLRRQSTMSVQWDEKVLWPGLQSLFLGLSQNREGPEVELFIGWFFVRRILWALPIVYLGDWQYLQFVINLVLPLDTALLVFHWRPFMYRHNMALELLDESLLFLIAMICICFTPFMVDPAWRLMAGYFVITQMVVIAGANLMLMWHSIIWQVSYKMDQEERVYEAIIQRGKTALEKQQKKEKEQEKLTQLQVINELSSSDASDSDDMDDSRQPVLNDLEQLVAIGPDVVAPETEGEEESSPSDEEVAEEPFEEEKESGLELSEPSPPPSSKGPENAQDQQ